MTLLRIAIAAGAAIGCAAVFVKNADRTPPASIEVTAVRTTEVLKMNSMESLQSDLKHADAARRAAAAEALAQQGEEAAPAVLELLAACADEDETVREWATSALEGLGAPAPQHETALVTALGSESPTAVFWAATLVGRLASRSPETADALLKVANKHNDLAARQRAIWALGRFGLGSPAVLDALRGFASSADARTARLAHDALRELEP